MLIKEIQHYLTERDARPLHCERILRAWLAAKPLDAGAKRHPAADFLPLAVRNDLAQLSDTLSGLLRIHSSETGADGSTRLLLALTDGQTIETVRLPKDGLCVSTQVGCAVGCTFCQTGRSGLIRQVGSAEIVAQVVLARRLGPVKRVVFMGMGEPAHNLKNVLDAIDLLGTAGAIGHKNLVFSSVGDLRIFERLPQGRVKPALALSLHSSRAELRAQLLPKAPRITPEELVALGEAYARATAYPIQYQWTLLEGINDSDAELEGIVRLLKGRYAMMNFIPYNATEGMPYQRPSDERAHYMAGYLHQHGIITRLRQSAGQDIQGGCGQLRARHV
jgi:23S rRNA (adenine2503-C2)-methyltransferase